MPNLVGIGNSQVPTNAMLGGLAYQNPDNAQLTSVEIEKFAKISSQHQDQDSGAPNGIFVYDTKKDSDGGAWRKRTSHTSWYNEPISSARGHRREFPAVAVIVSWNNGFTIYDGDDPNMSMWMNLWQYQNNVSGNTQWWGGSGNGGPIAAKNGVIIFSATTGGARNIHLINDRLSIFYNSTGHYSPTGGVANRHDASGGWRPSDHYYGLTWGSPVNDVSVIVEPNAPIDPETDLPEPTFIVGSDRAITLLRLPSGNGINTAEDDTYHVDRISLTDEGGVLVSADADANNNSCIAYGKFEHLNGLAWSTFANWQAVWYWSNYTQKAAAIYGSASDAIVLVEYMKRNGTGPGASLDFTVGSSEGVNLINFDPDYVITSSTNNSLVARVTKDFCSGYMTRDVKGAWLADTDDTDITGGGDGFITGNNSTFGDTISNLDWSERSGTSWNVSGGVLKTGTVSGGEYLDITLSSYTSGQKHVITYTIANKTGSNPLRWRYNDGQMGDLPSSNGSHVYYVTLTESGTKFSLINDASLTADIDNFKIQRVQDDDRSFNNKGLVTYGTLAKTAVADGAELVSYGPFSSSNYLYQPYNSDLDFTTSFSVMFWVKGWENSHDLLHRGPGQTRNSKTSFHLYNDSGYDYRLTLSSDGSTEKTYEIPLSQNVNGWHHVCFTLDSEKVQGYLDGEFMDLTSDTSPQSDQFTGNIFSQATDKNGLWIGRGPVSSDFDGYLALLRLSATVPGGDQVKKIFMEEKVLFAENTKCTLYGTSDDITAMAYDDGTDLLHVGTSSGRSDLRGLVRINNTTTAVTTDISASNGLIAEQ